MFQNRINNLPESFNKRKKEISYPSFYKWSDTIEKESRGQVQHLDDIRYRYSISLVYARVVISNLPPDYPFLI